MSPQKRLLGYILPYKHLFIASALCGAVVAATNAYIGPLSSRFTEAINHRHPEAVFMIALTYVLMYIPRGLALFWQSYWVSKATNRIAANLRTEIYSHIQRMSLSFFERNKTGHLMSRITSDVGLIQNGAGFVIDALTDPIMLVGGIGYMFVISWKLALIVLVFVPILSVTINKVGRKMKKLTTGLQTKLADLTSVLEETIAGVRIVKSFVMETHEVKRFNQQNEASFDFALRSAKRSAAAISIVEFITALGVAAMIVVGGMLVASNQLTPGSLVAFAAVGFFVSAAGKRLARLVVVYQQVMAGMERIFEILDQQPELTDKPDAKELSRLEGSVEFRDVCFGYNDGPPVLDSLSFTIEPGQVVAVVGPSGAGKSTIANLIPRFYDVTGGAVLVDGDDIRDVKIKSLRQQIGIVPQETVLFGGTIRENIAYGKMDATDEEIVAAAKAGNAHSFISALPEGYDTVIGERGVKLSGGERQRVAIARALLKDPRILILDEATSSLDADSEKIVQSALEVLMKGRSTLVIAHRLSTITKANKILVLADGKVVESGTFSELVAKSGLFAQLYNTQFRTERPAQACEIAR